MNYESRVQALEAEGLTRSDAQAVVDAENLGLINAQSQHLTANRAAAWNGIERRKAQTNDTLNSAHAIAQRRRFGDTK